MKKRPYNKFAKQMSALRAVAIVGGSIEARDTDEVLAAWQYIHDHKFGHGMRKPIADTLDRLIRNGLVYV